MSAAVGSPRTAWLATALLAVGTFVGIYGLGELIDTDDWPPTLAGLMAIVALAVIATRAFSRSRALPTAVGAVAALFVLVPAFARNDDGARRLLPTPGAVMDLAEALREGVAQAASVAPPVEGTREFVAVIAVAMIAMFLMVEHLAVSWRAGATAGVLMFLPWLSAIVFYSEFSLLALTVALACWFGAMALTRRGPTVERPPSVGGALAATAATVLAMIIVVPTAVGGQGWGDIPRFERSSEFDTATRLNLELDLRNSLTSDSQSPVLTYQATGTRPDTFRLYALTEFDGDSWSQTEHEAPTIPATTGVLWPEQVLNWSNRPHQQISIQIQTLSEQSLPMPVAPRTVNVDSNWVYDRTRDEVRSTGPDTQGVTYDVVTDLNYHDGRTLQATQEAIDAGGDSAVGSEYLDVAQDIDRDRVQELAQELTVNATTRYEQALALQHYLRDTDQFTYDVSITPGSGDSVSTFLDERSGYCVQFATTMVVMARTLDIPARLAVGFLNGSRDNTGTGYVVRGSDAHAWPELYFPERGWVRFEPTPAVQTGSLPDWADPNAGQVPVPRDVLDGGQQQPLPEVPETPVEAPAPPPAGATDPAPVTEWWVWAAAAVGVVLVALVWMWWRRRTVTLTQGKDGIEGAWQQFRARLGDDMAWPDTYTPHEAAEHVQARMRLFGYGLTGAARESLTKLSNAVSDHRYAPAGTQVESDAMAQWSEDVMVEVDQAREAETTDRPARGGGRIGLRRGA